MSLLPLLFSAWWADLERPHRLLDQHFGMGLFPEELLLPSAFDRLYPSAPNRAALELYYRPLIEFMRQNKGGTSTITADKDTFKVMLDVQQFKPEEVTVKLVGRFIVVEAKHEEKKDTHGFVSRQFVRKYLLPEQVDETKLASNISSDGILTITAPVKAVEQETNERTIKIELTGKPALRTDTTLEGTTTTATTEKPVTTEELTDNEYHEEVPKTEMQEKPEK